MATDLAPVITSQPQPQTGLEGANISLHVSASSPIGVRYVWRFYGADLPKDFPGQFTPLLSLRAVTIADSGPYSVVVTNNYGSVTSQTAVVSVNPYQGCIVGYINLRAEPGYSLLAAQLDNDSGTVAYRIPATYDGVSLFQVDGNGFAANNYLDGWSAPEEILAPGAGWFFYNPAAEPFDLTFVGQVTTGRDVNRLPGGFSLCSNIIPEAGGITSDLGFPKPPGAKVFLFDSASEAYSMYHIKDDEWIPSEPTVAVAQSFWVFQPAPVDWLQDLSHWAFFCWPADYLTVQPALTSETGEINFFTYNADGISGRVFDLDGTTPIQSNFAGQLYAGTNDLESTLAPIGAPALFRDGAGAGYIRASNIKLPGIVGGQNIFLQLRVWGKCAGNSYEQAVLNGSASGRSDVFGAIAHAVIENGAPGLPPRNANAFPPFQVAVAENSPIRVAGIQCTTNGVDICFATHPGWSYCLQKALSCEATAEWSPVPNAQEILGDGHVATVTDPMAQNTYYRLCRVR